MPTLPPPAAVHLIIHGRVQGVGFRYFALETAQSLALVGWVRNQRDGSVEAYAEGLKESLQTWISRLRQGPPLSRIESIDTVWRVPQNDLTSFSIQ